jgi:L-alanine-DL-glutamate epimerase-like enolase superfamily enzyme
MHFCFMLAVTVVEAHAAWEAPPTADKMARKIDKNGLESMEESCFGR